MLKLFSLLKGCQQYILRQNTLKPKPDFVGGFAALTLLCLRIRGLQAL